jgi:hypothetical protein
MLGGKRLVRVLFGMTKKIFQVCFAIPLLIGMLALVGRIEECPWELNIKLFTDAL